jgi:hypothetical protein
MATPNDMEREHRETWAGFCKLLTAVIIVVAVLLGGMALFLTSTPPPATPERESGPPGRVARSRHVCGGKADRSFSRRSRSRRRRS